MKTVRQLLRYKGDEVWSIGPDATVYDAINMMTRKDIGALAVKDGERLIGLISERHYVRNVALRGKTSVGTPVREIMERRVVTAVPDESVEECMALMTEARVRHLPILDHGQIIGIVSIGDLVQSIISDHEFAIEQLEQYIHG
jgi:CBS domain-containing protein